MGLPSQLTELTPFMQEQMERIIATLPRHRIQHLQERADLEGQSLSNLVTHLLEETKA